MRAVGAEAFVTYHYLRVKKQKSWADLLASGGREWTYHLRARVDQMITAEDVGSFSWWPKNWKQDESLGAPRSMIMMLSSVIFILDSRSARIANFSLSERSQIKTEY